MKAVLLAAGLSRRFGTGEQKILKEYHGERLVLRSLRACLSFFDVVLVTGYKSDEVEACVSDFLHENRFSHECRMVFNDKYETGQFSSCLVGVRNVSEDFMIALSDTPNLDEELIATMNRRFADMSPEYNVLRPFANGVPVHPVMFRASARELVLNGAVRSSGDIGLKDVIRNDAGFRVCRIDVSGSRYAKDVDHPEDLE